MKKIIFVLILISNMSLLSQTKADDITGIWYMHKRSDNSITVAEIFKNTDGKYYAYGFDYKVKGNNIQVNDVNNSNAYLKGLPLKGLVVVYELSFDASEWKNGYIYNPDNGKTYNLKAKLKNKNTIVLRASVDSGGVFGSTMEWTRAESNNIYKPLERSKLRYLSNK